MRYGIISDIHSNLEALNAALEHIGGVDAYICPGDIVGYGANPNECCDIIRNLAPAVVIGNHDAAVIGTLDLSWFNRNATMAAKWTNGVLSEANREFLLKLQPTVSERQHVVVHGSLDDPLSFDYIMSPSAARPSFDAAQPGVRVIFIGHTHVAEYYSRRQGSLEVDQFYLTGGGKVRLRHDFSYVVNCGSVGQPRDGNPAASCGVYDADEQTIEVFRVPYDLHAAQAKIHEAGLPAPLADRLTLGV